MANPVRLLLAAPLILLGAASPPVLTPHGYGWLKIPGMSASAAAATAPAPVRSADSDDPAACEEYQVGDTGIAYLTLRNSVARVTVYRPGVATAEGVQVGDTAAKVRAVYGRKVRSEPAPYDDPPAEDLYVWETPDYGYRFEIDSEGRVAKIHAGSAAIRFIEGCL